MAATTPPALEAKILGILRASKRPFFGTEKLAKAVGLSKSELRTILKDLTERGEVVRGKSRRVALSDRAGLLTGTLRMGPKGSGVVTLDIPDAPLSIRGRDARPALDGDHVLVEAASFSRRGLTPCVVKKVLKRKRTHVTGVASKNNPRQLIPTDSRLSDYVVVLDDDSPDAPPNRVCSAKVTSYPTSYSDLVVSVEETLGEVGTLETEIHTACHSVGISEKFSRETLAEVETFTEPGKMEIEARLDLRGATTVTIDPSDAKDHDDAISIEESADGFCLTVSIADVSYYVRPGTKVDSEALERANSTYFPGRAVPMLPERLSSDLASLVPERDRLAVSVILDIDREGNVTGRRFARSVIHSRAKLTYETAQRSLDGDLSAVPDEQVRSSLKTMARCASRLHEKRLQRGALDLDIPEAEILLNEKGKPVSIHKKERLATHRLIEEFALAANEAVAEELGEHNVPLLYRIHEDPDDRAIDEISDRLLAVGIRLKLKGGKLSPRMIQDILAQAAGKPTMRPVNVFVLRALERARYSAEKSGHFGLASKAYTHFTSPIRRYPDLVVHRALTALLEGKTERLPSREALRPLAAHCSDRERLSAEAERDIKKAAAVILMSDRIGKTFEGTVSGVTRNGFFVEIDEPFVEGFVYVGRLTEYYQFIRERLELHSRVSDSTIRIGQRTAVRVIAVDLTSRNIDLEPA